ncbi:hypothetical protein LTR62_004567 [Meristemomyces frigidus]|uniref:Uncharacterized protein n=1 Tax=Meristemomyces frigidus TaxID=1508187 RepID=A0AAN7TH37_9PEZI|nr:hypothetical protein LTR62_004567 [Meristemomyces frigidus]
MPCDNVGHSHPWPTSGQLIIERCENICNYCTGADRKHKWKFAWFLRRHVNKVHIAHGDYPDVVLADGWTRAKDGLARPTQPKKKAPPRSARQNHVKKTTSGDRTDSPQLPLPEFGSSTSVGVADMMAHYHDTVARRLDFTTLAEQTFIHEPENILVAPTLTSSSSFTPLAEDTASFVPYPGHTLQTCSLAALETSNLTGLTESTLPGHLGNSAV